MSNPTSGVDQAGFVNHALNAVPRWAAASIGTMIGAAIAAVFILVLGGMQGPVTRIANAYAAKIEASATSVGAATDRLVTVTHKIEGLETATRAYLIQLSDAVRRLERIEQAQTRQNDALGEHDRRITRIENRLRR